MFRALLFLAVLVAVTQQCQKLKKKRSVEEIGQNGQVTVVFNHKYSEFNAKLHRALMNTMINAYRLTRGYNLVPLVPFEQSINVDGKLGFQLDFPNVENCEEFVTQTEELRNQSKLQVSSVHGSCGEQQF